MKTELSNIEGRLYEVANLCRTVELACQEDEMVHVVGAMAIANRLLQELASDVDMLHRGGRATGATVAELAERRR
jgi:hypothetical protein